MASGLMSSSALLIMISEQAKLNWSGILLASESSDVINFLNSSRTYGHLPEVKPNAAGIDVIKKSLFHEKTVIACKSAIDTGIIPEGAIELNSDQTNLIHLIDQGVITDELVSYLFSNGELNKGRWNTVARRGFIAVKGISQKSQLSTIIRHTETESILNLGTPCFSWCDTCIKVPKINGCSNNSPVPYIRLFTDDIIEEVNKLEKPTCANDLGDVNAINFWYKQLLGESFVNTVLRHILEHTKVPKLYVWTKWLRKEDVDDCNALIEEYPRRFFVRVSLCTDTLVKRFKTPPQHTWLSKLNPAGIERNFQLWPEPGKTDDDLLQDVMHLFEHVPKGEGSVDTFSAVRFVQNPGAVMAVSEQGVNDSALFNHIMSLKGDAVEVRKNENNRPVTMYTGKARQFLESRGINPAINELNKTVKKKHPKAKRYKCQYILGSTCKHPMVECSKTCVNYLRFEGKYTENGIQEDRSHQERCSNGVGG